jgi:hypothetical protein
MLWSKKYRFGVISVLFDFYNENVALLADLWG